MTQFCNCSYCSKKESIINPYAIYQKEFSLTELQLSFDYRVTALCKYGCKRFRNKPTCPPNIPDMEYYVRALNECENIYIIGRKYPYCDGLFSIHWRTYSTNEVHHLLLKKEVELFKKGYVYAKAFIGGSCKVCSPNVCNPKRCNRPHKGRAPIEGIGLSVFSLMTAIGLEYQEPPEDFFWRTGVVLF